MTLTPSVSLPLQETLENRYLAGVSRTFDDRWVVLSMDKTAWPSPERREPLVPPFKFRVRTHDRAGWCDVFPEMVTDKFYGVAQPLKNGDWLLVQERTHGPQEPNGDVFDEDGKLVRSVFLDDGIEDVQTSSAGDIWVSYFDEGVFGGGQYSQCGLVCFAGDGTPRMEFTPDIVERFGISDMISDCYALNVCENGETWTSYYTDFPIVKLKGINFEKAWTDFPARPIRAFAVSRGRLLLVPAYQKTGPLLLCDLENRAIGEVELVDSAGKKFEFDKAIGRNATLGFVCDWNSRHPVLHQFNFE